MERIIVESAIDSKKNKSPSETGYWLFWVVMTTLRCAPEGCRAEGILLIVIFCVELGPTTLWRKEIRRHLQVLSHIAGHLKIRTL